MSELKIRMTRPVATLALGALLFFPAAPRTDAAGFFLPNQSMEATMRGNAWVATADSAAAVHYNPAGLVQLDGPSLESGLYVINLGNSVDLDLDLNGDGDTTHTAKESWQAVPQLYYGQPIGDGLAVGVGVNAPFGLGTEWGPGTDFSSVPGAIQGALFYLRASAVASYQITDTLSLGAGFALDYGKATLDQSIVGVPGSKLRFEGDGTALTGIFGLLWNPHPQHSFGLVYRTVAEMSLQGDVSSNPVGVGLPAGRASLGLYAPASGAIGYAFKPNDDLTIEANVEWVDFDGLNTLTLRSAALPGGAAPIPFNWESSIIWEIGLSYRFHENYIFHIGYDYNQSAQPDTFYNPAVADADRHWINLGVTRETEKLALSLGYQFGWSDREVNNSVLGTNGDYEARHHALLGSVRYKF